MKRIFILVVVVFTIAWVSLSTTTLAQPLDIRPLAEKEVMELPKDSLFWRIENFDSLEQAKATAGPWSLVAMSAGRVWLFTLGPKGGASTGGTKVTEVGPIATVEAPRFLLRINEVTGVPGSSTPVHTHPGSEAFYVLAGEQSIRTFHGLVRINAKETENGHGADIPMQISSSGADNLLALVMFVVDATRPFTSPAQFP